VSALSADDELGGPVNCGGDNAEAKAACSCAIPDAVVTPSWAAIEFASDAASCLTMSACDTPALSFAAISSASCCTAGDTVVVALDADAEVVPERKADFGEAVPAVTIAAMRDCNCAAKFPIAGGACVVLAFALANAGKSASDALGLGDPDAAGLIFRAG
jgi:hypothetical protein